MNHFSVIRLRTKRYLVNAKKLIKTEKMRAFCLIALWLGLTLPALAQDTLTQDWNKPYEFPVRPGMEAWKALSSGQEMAEATVIPKEYIDSLTTTALVETILSYPLFIDVLLHDNLQVGFERLLPFANGLAALLTRKDAGESVLSKYEALQIPRVAARGVRSFEDLYLELLLSREEVLNTLDEEKRKKLQSVVYEKTASKLENEDYGKISIESAVLILAKILVRSGEQDTLLTSASEQELASFLQSGRDCSDALLSKILTLSKP
jgi:hypothetical protein